MSTLRFRCDCGRALSAPESAAGRRGRCPACGTVFTVPAAVVAEPTPVVAVSPPDVGGYALAEELRPPVQRPPAFRPPPPPAKVAVPEPTAPLPPAATGRPYRYLFLLLALLPLAWSTVRAAPHESLTDHIVQTVRAHPEVRERLAALPDDPDKAEVLAALPNDRCDGALLPHDTYLHWGLAAASGAFFVTLVLVLFPPGHTRVAHLLGVSLFTGTAGILLLLAFQWLAFHMPFFTPRGALSLLLDLVWLIGQSYALALGDHGLVASAVGFTAGVGLCEEACKAIPLLVKARGGGVGGGRGGGFVNWRSAMLWGLISGVGFGVSEGITYSSDYYNGVLGGGVYGVRFVSCVALHAIWSAAVGIAIYRRQAHLQARQMGVADWLLQTLVVVAVPMCLHGLYDTLLKQDHDAVALTVAVASFGWLAVQIEQAKRRFDPADPAAGRGFEVVPG